MSVTYTGQLKENGIIELDQTPPLAPGRVRLELHPEPPAQDPEEAEWAHRKAVMDAAIGCLSDEEAQEILQTIEREFEQINPDDWR